MAEGGATEEETGKEGEEEETGNKRYPYNKLFEMASYPHFTPDGLKICRRWAQECIDSMEV